MLQCTTITGNLSISGAQLLFCAQWLLKYAALPPCNFHIAVYLKQHINTVCAKFRESQRKTVRGAAIGKSLTKHIQTDSQCIL